MFVRVAFKMSEMGYKALPEGSPAYSNNYLYMLPPLVTGEKIQFNCLSWLGLVPLESSLLHLSLASKSINSWLP